MKYNSVYVKPFITLLGKEQCCILVKRSGSSSRAQTVRDGCLLQNLDILPCEDWKGIAATLSDHSGKERKAAERQNRMVAIKSNTYWVRIKVKLSISMTLELNEVFIWKWEVKHNVLSNGKEKFTIELAKRIWHTFEASSSWKFGHPSWIRLSSDSEDAFDGMEHLMWAWYLVRAVRACKAKFRLWKQEGCTSERARIANKKVQQGLFARVHTFLNLHRYAIP